jgi:hypothetical protein
MSRVGKYSRMSKCPVAMVWATSAKGRASHRLLFVEFKSRVELDSTFLVLTKTRFYLFEKSSDAFFKIFDRGFLAPSGGHIPIAHHDRFRIALIQV